ncbi:MAG: hypothetical protein U1E78_05935 [Gammaproteobacteria bacterium]
MTAQNFAKTIEELALEQANVAEQRRAEQNARDTQFLFNLKEAMRQKLDAIRFRIFWEEKLEAEALKLFIQTKKAKDVEQLLLWAIQCQNYTVAQELIKQSAQPNAMHVEALSFSLENHIRYGQKQSTEQVLHPVKHFGLALGFDTTINGIRSQRAQMQQPFHLLSTQLKDYAEHLNADHAFKNEFTAIANAYAYSEQAIQFSGSRVSNPQAAQALAKRYQAGEIAVIPCGWKGHAISVSLVNGHLVLTNRGESGNRDFGTQIYKITDPEKINAGFIHTLLSGIQNNATPQDILNAVGKVVDPNPVMQIAAKAQKYQNCTYVNPKSNVEGILSVLAMNNPKLKAATHAAYKEMTDSFRRELASDLVARYQISYGSEKAMYREIMQAYIKAHALSSKAIDQECISMMEQHISVDVGQNKSMIRTPYTQTSSLKLMKAPRPTPEVVGNQSRRLVVN